MDIKIKLKLLLKIFNIWQTLNAFFRLKLMSWKLMLKYPYENIHKWVISTNTRWTAQPVSLFPMPAQTNQNTNIYSLILLHI